ncbi:MAG TPA: hypothetical protein VFI76_04095 [Terrimicrobiaceae bacterium]|nr:hypothetical protein [Terrimicrobiaceae bacterium]
MAKDAPATTDQMTVTQFMNSCQTMAWTDGPFNRSLPPRYEVREQVCQDMNLSLPGEI